MRLFIVMLLLVAAPVWAQQTPDYEAPPVDTLYPLPEVEGSVPWELLLNIQFFYEGIDLVPEYLPEVLALEDEQIQIVGFLMPLAMDGTRGLLSMISPACPFCLPGGPETFVELRAETPLEWTEDAVLITGRLELMTDSYSGFYYRLTQAERLPLPPSS
jgi:uncharacterized protein